jgi:hypothetical protein
MAATEHVTVGVVLERRKAVSVWIDHLWVPVAVLPGAPELPPWTPLGTTDTGERFFAGAFDMGLFRTDTPTYRDNLASGDPRIWVAARPTGAEPPLQIVGVTADPAEGESYTEAGDDIVEHVPMAPELVALLQDFVALHHVERVFVKRRRRRWASDEDEDQA